jgi:hypothetical protein
MSENFFNSFELKKRDPHEVACSDTILLPRHYTRTSRLNMQVTEQQLRSVPPSSSEYSRSKRNLAG